MTTSWQASTPGSHPNAIARPVNCSLASRGCLTRLLARCRSRPCFARAPPSRSRRAEGHGGAPRRRDAPPEPGDKVTSRFLWSRGRDGTAIGRIPAMPAGRRSIAWQLPPGSRRVRFAIRCLERLDHRRPDELCLRGRAMRSSPTSPCPQARRRPNLPVRAQVRLSGLHRQDLRARERHSRRPHRGAGRRASREFDASARRCRAARQPARFERGRRRVRLGSRCPPRWGWRSLFLSAHRARRYSAPQSVSRQRRLLMVETGAGRALPAAIEGVLSLGDGQGLARRPARPSLPRRVAGAGAARRRRCAGRSCRARRRVARRADAQHHALRLPDSEPQGARLCRGGWSAPLVDLPVGNIAPVPLSKCSTSAPVNQSLSLISKSSSAVPSDKFS